MPPAGPISLVPEPGSSQGCPVQGDRWPSLALRWGGGAPVGQTLQRRSAHGPCWLRVPVFVWCWCHPVGDTG